LCLCGYDPGNCLQDWSQLQTYKVRTTGVRSRFEWVVSSPKTKTLLLHVFFMGKPEGEKPLRGPRRRWKDNMKRDLQEVVWGHGPDWSTQDRDRW